MGSPETRYSLVVQEWLPLSTLRMSGMVLSVLLLIFPFDMVGSHDRLHGHEFEQIRGHREGQGSLACCSPWGCKELDMTY